MLRVTEASSLVLTFKLVLNMQADTHTMHRYT